MDGGRPSVSELSRGEYGARVGLGHVVDLLADFEIPASFFIPAVQLAHGRRRDGPRPARRELHVAARVVADSH